MGKEEGKGKGRGREGEGKGRERKMVASVSYCLSLDKYSLSILTCFGFDAT